MGLSKYYEKRDFRKTREPRGKEHKGSKAHRFVIQKHAASHLHYDFRLEMEGVLRSWAVPKGPSLDPAVKRLAMHVEDHPIEYGTFEGTIPKGQYGGGTVMLWDHGEWTPEGDALEGYRKGRLKFRLEGEKLHGSWALVRMGGDGKSWLLFKERDKDARATDEFDVTGELTESVTTNRTMEEIAAAEDNVWQSNREPKKEDARIARIREKATRTKKTAPSRSAKKTTKTKRQTGKDKETGRETIELKSLTGARKAPFPGFVEPQKATLVRTAPSGDEWIHEIKLDGYRMLCQKDGKDISFISRNGNDWTSKFRPLVKEVKELKSRNFILDGEVVALDPEGRSSFQLLQNALGDARAKNMAYIIFDVLYLDGYDVQGVSQEERKELARQLIEKSDVDGNLIRYSEHFEAAGPDVFRQACGFALEGIVSKLKSAPYSSGRTKSWVKTKCIQRQEFVIGGYTQPSGSRSDFGALLVGVKDKEGKLRFSGKVGTGFTQKSLKELKQKLTPLHADSAPFINPPRGAAYRGTQWVQPDLVCEIEFTEWTSDEKLRHPSFQGLREDKPPTEVVAEKPVAEATVKHATAKVQKSKTTRTKKSTTSRTKATSRQETTKAKGKASVKRTKDGANEFAGVRLTSPDKVLYPEQGITKLQLAEYYAAVADWILPYVKDRPLTLVRCPEGHKKHCFYQKHAGDSTSDILDRIEISEKSGKDIYLSLNAVQGLIALVQMGVLEIHVWGSTNAKLENPDQLILDLDPDPTVEWKQMIDTAHLLREMLTDAGLVPFVKTTGGKGLHIVVPLNQKNSWEEVRMFAELVATVVVSSNPALYLAVATKSKRVKKIYIDYLRNGRGATAIVPYSTRAREGAPVSVPVAWEEVTAKLRPDEWTVETLPKRLEKLKKDPWKEFHKSRKAITQKVIEKIASYKK